MFLCAELTCVLARQREWSIIAKGASHRTNEEQKQVDSGVLSSVITETLLFVPASAALVLLAIVPFVLPVILASAQSRLPNTELETAAYSLAGMISYGFPFAAIRRLVTLVAINTLQLAISLHKASEKPQPKQTPRQASAP